MQKETMLSLAEEITGQRVWLGFSENVRMRMPDVVGKDVVDLEGRQPHL